MTMQNNINIIWRTFRRNMLQTKLHTGPNEIDNQRPVEVGVTIAANNRDRRTDRTQLFQDDIRADIAQVPYLVRVLCQRFNN